MIYRLQEPLQLKSFIEGLRKQSGYTQKDVGILLGISQQAYQKIENNPERVSFERIMYIMKLFNASVAVEDNINLDFRKTDIHAENQPKGSKVNLDIKEYTVSEKEGLNRPTQDPETDRQSKTVLIVKPTGAKPKW